jgi:hypothetical protein
MNFIISAKYPVNGKEIQSRETKYRMDFGQTNAADLCHVNCRSQRFEKMVKLLFAIWL